MDTLESLTNLAALHFAEGRYAEAEPLAREFMSKTPKKSPEYRSRRELLESIVTALEEADQDLENGGLR